MSTEATPLVPSAVQLDEAYHDTTTEMTRGRRIARYLSQFSWYDPHANSTEEDKPSLDKAWAYFEHFTLPRYKVAESATMGDLVRAEPGEHAVDTNFYPIWGTSESDLADFGIAVGVYFFTLKVLAVLMFIAAAINIPAMNYYRSNSYNAGNAGINRWSLQSSAICTDTSWAACPTCTFSQWNVFPVTKLRYASADVNGQTLSFIRVNNCKITSHVAVYSFASLMFFCVAIWALGIVSKRKEQQFDDAQQTTPDYAVEVQNPPLDARDAEEWKAFFEQFGPVTSITVVLDNEELVNMLIKRRKLIAALENLQPAGVKVDRSNLAAAIETANPPSWLGRLMCKSSAPHVVKTIETMDKFIEEKLATKTYNVSEVFAIFETESAKTDCLNGLALTGLQLSRKDPSALPPERVFRGETLLQIRNAPEPNSVRWRDLDETMLVRFFQRTITSLLTLAIVAGVVVLVIVMRGQYGVVASALTITASTSLIPILLRLICLFESHENEGSWQTSLYVKLTFSLWIVSAILTAYITPFSDSLEYNKRALIPAMYALFIAEMFKSPIIAMSDILGNIKRHLLGPRQLDQRRMNRYFQGSIYRLSTRYTEMTKVLFMTFYYAFIFPPGFLFAGVTLAVTYWVDKFSLMRKWARAPMLDNDIAQMSRRFFFTISLAVFAIMSSYNYAAFPFDNACDEGTTVGPSYVGSFNATRADGTPITFAIPSGSKNYKFCNQDMLKYRPFPAFPPIPAKQPAGSKWMGPGQDFTSVFGWALIGVLIYVLLLMLRVVWIYFRNFFFAAEHFSKPRPSINFSEVIDISAYVPEHLIPGALFPTLLCDVSKIDESLIGWDDIDDPSRNTHNAIFDLPCLTRAAEGDTVFSMVKHWPPMEKGK